MLPPPFWGRIGVMIFIFLLIINLNTPRAGSVCSSDFFWQFKLSHEKLWLVSYILALWPHSPPYSVLTAELFVPDLSVWSPGNVWPPVHHIHLQPSGVSGSVTGHENGPSATSHLQLHLPDHLEGVYWVSTGAHSGTEPFPWVSSWLEILYLFLDQPFRICDIYFQGNWFPAQCLRRYLLRFSLIKKKTQ